MKRKSPAAGIVLTVIGGLCALFALFGLIGSAVMASAASIDGDAAYAAGRIVGVLFWAVLAALFLTLGIRKLRQVSRENAQPLQSGTQDR